MGRSQYKSDQQTRWKVNSLERAEEENLVRRLFVWLDANYGRSSKSTFLVVRARRLQKLINEIYCDTLSY